MFGKIQKFIAEVIAEMKKVSWPTRKELVDSSLIVVFSSAVLTIFVSVIDFILSKGVTSILK